MKHFLTLKDLSVEQHQRLIKRALALKLQRQNNQTHSTLQGKILAMIFQKASTRTRVSFEAGILQLGGQALFIASQDTQLQRGEPISDTAKIVSSMVDLIMIRTTSHQNILEFSKHSYVPVINGLTDSHHPCQLLADLMTITEHFGSIDNKKIAWIGDGNNMCNSYLQLAELFNIELKIYNPEGYQIDLSHLPKTVKVQRCHSPEEAVQNVDVITTDVWSSMGHEQQTEQRQKIFAHCQVDQNLMSQASPHAIFLHCLPAHRGEEVTAEVIDGNQSLIWQQAENRLHVQKALMEQLLNE